MLPPSSTYTHADRRCEMLLMQIALQVNLKIILQPLMMSRTKKLQAVRTRTRLGCPKMGAAGPMLANMQWYLLMQGQ